MSTWQGKLAFVDQDEDMSGATFRDEAGQEFHLNNLAIQQHGLVDIMREAMNAAIESHGRPVTAQHDATAEQEDGRPTNGAGDQRPPAEPPSQLVGGYTTEWRWDLVRDGESVLVCIDNQPAIRGHDDPTKPTPQLQRIVIPVDILRVIAGST